MRNERFPHLKFVRITFLELTDPVIDAGLLKSAFEAVGVGLIAEEIQTRELRLNPLLFHIWVKLQHPKNSPLGGQDIKCAKQL